MWTSGVQAGIRIVSDEGDRAARLDEARLAMAKLNWPNEAGADGGVAELEPGDESADGLFLITIPAGLEGHGLVFVVEGLPHEGEWTEISVEWP